MPRTPKKLIPATMIDKLRKGPVSLSGSGDAMFLAIDANVTRAQAEAVRAALFKSYSIWLETWIVPELQRLLSPAERAAATEAERAIAAARTTSE